MQEFRYLEKFRALRLRLQIEGICDLEIPNDSIGSGEGLNFPSGVCGGRGLEANASKVNTFGLNLCATSSTQGSGTLMTI